MTHVIFISLIRHNLLCDIISNYFDDKTNILIHQSLDTFTKLPLDHLSQPSETCVQKLINWNTNRCRKLTSHILPTKCLLQSLDLPSVINEVFF